MAATNRTRENTNNQKLGVSVATVHEIDYTELLNDGSIYFVLPKHSILVHLGVIEEEAANAGAQATITFGADTIVANGAIDTSGIYTLAPSHHDLAGDVIIKAGSTPPSQGKFTFFFMYIEHEKHTGEYTNYSDE